MSEKRENPSPGHSEVVGPVTAGSRIEAIDTLRGFALLGILVMNITGIALPSAAYFNPTVYGGSTGGNFGAWVFAHLFFELKMMGIFSMLFGAGLILMSERAKARAHPFGRIHYRRIFWLLLFGLVHSYLLWYGDILVTYALCGIFLFLFRNRSARTLLITGLALLLLGAMLTSGGGLMMDQLRNAAHEIEGKAAAGEEMTPREQVLLDQWGELRSSFEPTPEEAERMVKTMRGDSGGALRENARESVTMHTKALPFMLFWRVMGMMLLGMALTKTGVLTMKRSPGFYRNWVIFGFGLGLPVVAFGIWRLQLHDFDFVARFLVDGQYNYFASIPVSMAYVGLVMLACQSGKFLGIRARLAAVGRMALTNYLLQSVIGVAIFYGYGLGLFGQVERLNLWWFILGIWIMQLALSPWWLSRFRHGPVEWLWRTLTYWRKQPMRVARD